MDPIDAEYREAQEKIGTEYCVACAVRGLIEDGSPKSVVMEVRWSHIGERPYREDIQIKCPECKATRQHGFGISEKEWENKHERRGKKQLDVFVENLTEVDKQHLRDLGYIEV